MQTNHVYLGMAIIMAAAVTQAGSAQTFAGRPPGGDRTDFALFDGTDPTSGETGVACGARRGESHQTIAFTYFVTISNWTSEVRVVRVLYADDEEMARYQIPPNSSFAFSQAAGGTRGVDDLIRVFAETPTPSGLAGAMSILAPAAARPHPDLPGNALCVTLTTPMP